MGLGIPTILIINIKKVSKLVGVFNTITYKNVISSLFGPIKVTIQNDMLKSVHDLGYSF